MGLSDRNLARRKGRYGCSDLGVMALAMGVRGHGDHDPKWLRDKVVPYAFGEGEERRAPARWLLEKAGCIPAQKLTQSDRERLDRGNLLEEELLTLYFQMNPLAKNERLWYTSDIPDAFFPVQDRHSELLVATPDALIERKLPGVKQPQLIIVQAKCSGKEMDSVPWYYELQVQGEMAVMDADDAILVCGELWARPNTRRTPQSIKHWRIPKRPVGEEIRQMCRDATDTIARLKAAYDKIPEPADFAHIGKL